MYEINEDQLHELARLFMDQFNFSIALSLDGFLMEHRDELTDDERNLGFFILDMFNN